MTSGQDLFIVERTGEWRWITGFIVQVGARVCFGDKGHNCRFLKSIQREAFLCGKFVLKTSEIILYSIQCENVWSIHSHTQTLKQFIHKSTNNIHTHPMTLTVLLSICIECGVQKRAREGQAQFSTNISLNSITHCQLPSGFRTQRLKSELDEERGEQVKTKIVIYNLALLDK